MNDDRKSQLAGKLELRLEEPALVGQRGERAKAVEPGLSDRDSLWMREQLPELAESIRIPVRSLVRVDAERGEHALVPLGQRERGPRRRDPGPYGHDSRDPRRLRPSDKLVRRLARVEVRVRIRHVAAAAASIRESSSPNDLLRIELREQRGRLAERLARRERARCPAAHPAVVVAGEYHMLPTLGFHDRPELEGAGDQPVVAEELVQALRGEGEERREQDLEAVDRPKRHEEDRGGPLAIRVEERPGSLRRDVLVAEAGESHGLLQGALEPGGLDQRADRLESALHLLQQPGVRGGERPRLGNAAEVLVRALERPVDEIPPGRNELVVVPAHELGPREVGVLRLGTRDGDEVAQRVGVVSAQEVAHEDRDVPARAELLALHREELARGDVVGQLERAPSGAELAVLPVAEQNARPDHRVEHDVVLAHEVRVLG